MSELGWFDVLPVAVTICDAEGILLVSYPCVTKLECEWC